MPDYSAKQTSLPTRRLSGIAVAIALALNTSALGQEQFSPYYPPVSDSGEQIIGEIPGSARFLDDSLNATLWQSPIPFVIEPAIQNTPVLGPPIYSPGEVILPAGEIPGTTRTLYDSANSGLSPSYEGQSYGFNLENAYPPGVVLGEILPHEAQNDPAHASDGKVVNETLSSPSDKVADGNEPTLADNATIEIVAQLDEARKQITALKDELSEARQNSRTATERAYAAEKSASASRKNLEKNIAMLKADLKQANSQQSETSAEASAKLKSQQTKLRDLKGKLAELNKAFEANKVAWAKKESSITAKLKKSEAQRDGLKKRLANKETELKKSRSAVAKLTRSNAAALKDAAAATLAMKAQKSAAMHAQEAAKTHKRNMSNSGAQQRLAKLNRQAELFAKDKKAAAAKAAQEKSAKAEKKRKAKAAEEKKIAEAKKAKAKTARKKRRPAAADQIKKLRDSMERQVKRANQQITSRTEEKVASLIKKGKTEKSKEIRELTDDMKKSMKESEAKIRKRIESRIRKIQKEAAARDKS